MLADIVDGHGLHMLHSILSRKKSHLSPSLHWWPKQVPPTQSQWALWWKALCHSLSLTALLQLLSLLGNWEVSPDSWNWFWSDLDECLYEWIDTSWRIWTPIAQTCFYAQCFQATDQVIQSKLKNPQVALVEIHLRHITFLGAHTTHKNTTNKKLDFTSLIGMQLEASWAFHELLSSSNGKDIAQAITLSTCVVVSDGSFKDSIGTAAWIITNLAKATLSGSTTVPGSLHDQGSFWSELSGIYSTVCMVNHVCQYYSVTYGTILFGCDGLSALQQCLQCWWQVSPNTPQHDFICAIQMALAQSPIHWKWQHIWRHQDQSKAASELTLMENLNIQMDANAKQWWE